MKLTIIPVDETVIVDDVFFNGIDMSSVDPNVRAVQWDNGSGEIEHNDLSPNEVIYTVDDFQTVIDLWQAKKDYVDAVAADPYYDLTLEQAKEKKIDEIVNFALIKKAEAFDDGTNVLSPFGVQRITALESLALLVKAEGDSAWTTDVILEDTNPDGTNIRITVSADQIISKIRGLRQRDEDLNQVAQDNIDAVVVLTTVAEVRDYILPW